MGQLLEKYLPNMILLQIIFYVLNIFHKILWFVNNLHMIYAIIIAMLTKNKKKK